MFSSRLEIWSYQPISHQYYIMSKLQLKSGFIKWKFDFDKMLKQSKLSCVVSHLFKSRTKKLISVSPSWFLFLSYNKHIAKPLTVSNWGRWRNQSSQNTCNLHMLHQTNLLANTAGLHPTFLSGRTQCSAFWAVPVTQTGLCMEWWMPRLTSLVYIRHSNWPHAELSEQCPWHKLDSAWNG